MKAQIDEYKGWTIFGEVNTKSRFEQVVRWTAEKSGETVTLEAERVSTLKDLIDARENNPQEGRCF